MGLHIQLDQLAHTAEDAVSTMQPEAGEFLEMCDAVSKASGEAHSGEARSGGDKEENGYTESRVVQNTREESRERAPAITGTRRVTRSMANKRKGAP